ncbi:helix-turn-helix domain-containing protein [Pseudooceanicola sp. CBS1P-1]|uniref:Helix-turn-helix domain-containing protein n=1 Tax=Pseudooceanicola albus TaxID=2692189 RepID=A0A6L7G699_9RHOB|nr:MULTISPECIES: helix-turn-helix domain-containing protein [Pseudooceanicola]MBT9385998.1 helix-turn-helix domain-containing protein [Pseudooceanicola endophyticus]MXN19581.1 helix-turn-helix domain-containing protein [Pseudooceanicola albus]
MTPKRPPFVQDRPIRVGVLLFPRFSNHCLSNAVEPLRACNDLTGRTLFEWRYLGLEGGAVPSSSGLSVQTEARLSDDPGGDLLFVLPCYDHRALATPACARALRAARRRYATLVGMDTGSWLLAAAGLLDGRRATIHWDEWQALAETFPAVDVVQERVVHDGDLRSCGGALTTFELLLDLVEELHGPALRLALAAFWMQPDMPAPSPAARDLPQAAALLMRRHIEQPLTIAQIAARLGLSRRRLERLCRARFGCGPDALYRDTRLREARRLMRHTGLSVAEVATRCGYLDASALTRAFRRHFGDTPTQARALDAAP